MQFQIAFLNFSVISSLLLIFSNVKSENENEKLENPYKLIDDLDNKNVEYDDGYDDDDNNPFLFKPFKNKIIIEDDGSDTNPFFLLSPPSKQMDTKIDNQIYMIWHSDIMKIFYQQIVANKAFQRQSSENNFPIDVNFHMKFTEEMWINLEKYIDNNTKPSIINSYFLNQMSLETVEKVEEDNISHLSVSYQSEFVPVVIIVLIGLFCYAVLPKGKFVLLLLVLVIVHKGWELYHDELLEKEFISRNIPDHCLVGTAAQLDNASVWKRINNWFWHDSNQKECESVRQTIDRKAHYSANLMRIATALATDIVTGISDGIGVIVAINYVNLSDYLPWYLAPTFLLILFLMPFYFIWFIVTESFKAWIKHRKAKTPSHICSSRLPKKITYYKY